MIRRAAKADLKQICIIYAQGIATKIATFETQVPSEQQWDEKFHPTLRFVYEQAGEVVGWISVTPTSMREAYKGVLELSIYILQEASGQGIGQQLIEHLKREAKLEGAWMLQGTILEKNEASIRLHEKCSFRKVGKRIKIAQLHGEWQNTILMECHLN